MTSPSKPSHMRTLSSEKKSKRTHSRVNSHDYNAFNHQYAVFSPEKIDKLQHARTLSQQGRHSRSASFDATPKKKKQTHAQQDEEQQGNDANEAQQQPLDENVAVEQPEKSLLEDEEYEEGEQTPVQIDGATVRRDLDLPMSEKFVEGISFNIAVTL